MREAKTAGALGTFREISAWTERPADPRPPLEEAVSADVVIVGAGFAGLSTALELAAAGARVAVIEKDCAGFGASGRNAGYLAGGGGLEYALIEKLGTERARKIVGFYENAVPYVEGKFAQYGIDCDYVGSGLISAVIHPSQGKRLRDNLAKGVELGVAATFLDEAAMRAREIPPAFLFGYKTAGGGTLDPGKYIMGLRRAAIEAGVRLYENSPLVAFREEGRTVVCKTPHGEVGAPVAVFATNAFTPQLGLLRNKVGVVRVSGIETDPLSPTQLKGLGWPNREGITTKHHIMESHRLTARNSLVLTTKELCYMRGGKTPNIPYEPTYKALAGALHDRFPTLHGLGIRHRWSGYISMARDTMPVVGTTGTHGNIYYTSGCSGHGVASQSFMGKLLSEQIRGLENDYYVALRHEAPSMLPAPLEWVMMSSAFAMARLLDNGTNRKVR